MLVVAVDVIVILRESKPLLMMTMILIVIVQTNRHERGKREERETERQSLVEKRRTGNNAYDNGRMGENNEVDMEPIGWRSTTRGEARMEVKGKSSREGSREKENGGGGGDVMFVLCLT